MSDEHKPTPPVFVYPGSYKQARGVIPWQEGDEPAEVSIRRARGDVSTDAERIATLERQVAELTRRMNEQDGGK